MFLLLGIAAAQDQHDVLTYFNTIDQPCIRGKCADAMSQCEDDWNDCHERMSCVAYVKDVTKCFKKVKWAQLDSIEVQVLDCAHRNQCLEGGVSFVQRLAEEKTRRGMDPDGAEPRHNGNGTPSSFAETKAEAEMASTQRVATDIISAHLLYMKKSEELAKQTGALVEAVKASTAMDNKEKAKALDLLTEHLNALQDGADEAMTGLGLDIGGKGTSNEDGDAEDATTESKQDRQKVVAKLSKEDLMGEYHKMVSSNPKRLAAIRGEDPKKHLLRTK